MLKAAAIPWNVSAVTNVVESIRKPSSQIFAAITQRIILATQHGHDEAATVLADGPAIIPVHVRIVVDRDPMRLVSLATW